LPQNPGCDRNQYYNDWPSGWGVKEAINFFNKQSEKSPIVVYTEGTFGLMPASLEMYLGNNKNIIIKGIWPIPDKPSMEIIAVTKEKPSYILFFKMNHLLPGHYV